MELKNIHLIETDKPSRLIYNDANQLCYQSNKSYKNDRKWMHRKKFNIYITNDEEIKEGDWYINNGNLLKCTEVKKRSSCKKIILTTDNELIKNGVQAIDNEFLEWFVKNPNCEFVDVQKFTGLAEDYLIIIPKEESKQETLEEAANKNYRGDFTPKAFIDGAKWQQERMYSEEDLKLAYNASQEGWIGFDFWFKQFKKQ